jgi:hypothetical protein
MPFLLMKDYFLKLMEPNFGDEYFENSNFDSFDTLSSDVYSRKVL